MQNYIAPLEKLIESFRQLPGVGNKSAVRMAFGVLDMTEEAAEQFCAAIKSAKNDIVLCKKCCNLSDSEICSVCADEKRDQKTVCVVEDAKTVMAIEKVKEYNGVYHVLHGTISPMDGVGPDKLTIKELAERVAKNDIEEVIIATNPNVEGETTALYISKLLKPFGIKVTRLAYGVPVGADLDYADEVTLFRALDGRREL